MDNLCDYALINIRSINIRTNFLFSGFSTGSLVNFEILISKKKKFFLNKLLTLNMNVCVNFLLNSCLLIWIVKKLKFFEKCEQKKNMKTRNSRQALCFVNKQQKHSFFLHFAKELQHNNFLFNVSKYSFIINYRKIEQSNVNSTFQILGTIISLNVSPDTFIFQGIKLT